MLSLLRGVLSLLALYLMLSIATSPATATERAEPVQKGLGIIAYYQGQYPQMDQHLQTLAATGAEWVSVYVTVYQENINSTAITRTRADTPSDDDLRHVIAAAHALGLQVMLKPQIDLIQDDAHWRGQIGQNFATEAEWQQWFAAYTDMIVHYAELAAATGVEEFTLGTELQSVTHRAAEWRAIVAEVRAVYGGKVLYAANHSGEETRITWWDAVDYIGLAAYYELATDDTPTVSELQAAWAPHLQTLGELAARHGKQVIFVEIGYRSLNGAIQRPWCYLCTGPVDLEEQRVGYEALYTSLWHQPWLAGLYWWRWDIEATQSGPCDAGYSPHGKPAENVLRRWYGAPARVLPTDCGGTVATPTPVPTPLPPTATATPSATPTAVPEPGPTPLPGTTQTIYADQLATGWQDWSWESTVDLGATAVVQSGDRAIAVTYRDAWAGLSLHSETPLDLRGYGALHFWIRGTAAGQMLDLWLDSAATDSPTAVRIVPAVGEWREVIVPLAELGPHHAVAGLVWQDARGQAPSTIYLDAISLQGGAAPAPTQDPTATASATATPTGGLPNLATRTPTSTVTSTATPTGSGARPQPIFADELAAGWVDWSWRSVVDFAATGNVQQGRRSLEVRYVGAWGGLLLGRNSPFALSGYEQLHFWIYGNGEPIDVKLLALGAEQSARLRIVPPAGEWTAVTLPLADFGDIGSIGGIAWQNGTAEPQPPIYLDSIVLRAAADDLPGGQSTLPVTIMPHQTSIDPNAAQIIYLPITGS